MSAKPSSPKLTPSRSPTLRDAFELEATGEHGARLDPKAPPIASAKEERYLRGSRLFLVATALPVIASKFDGFNQITWIASAYFLTQGGCMLTYGQLLAIAPTKGVYLIAIALFELGLLFCGVAPSMELEQRPALLGSFGAAFALASVVGPLLGGVFTDKVSWRWCFYINLPFGAITVATIVWLIPKHPAMGGKEYEGMSSVRKWVSLDWVGSVLALGMVTALLLPLQWGGNQRPWNDRVVIALFCVCGFLIVTFIIWEWRMGNRAILRTSMFRRRTQVGACLALFFTMAVMLVGTYYLPVYFQVTRGHSATRSGIDILPFMLSVIIAAGATGGATNATGRYWPYLFASPLLCCIASGLLYTLDSTSGSGKEIGFQILLGVGVGGAFQTPLIAIQAEYADEEELIPQGTSLVTFTQLIGGIIGIAISGSVLANQLTKYLILYAPDLSPELSISVRQSVSAILTLPPDQKEFVIRAYSKALNNVFLFGIPAGFLASLSALLVKDYNLKTIGIKPGATASA
ncbi:MFS general substrate transporter [Ceratobasidium sp. AG-I]|nr:MFS general substrate transporter [Ceratobasidium sp. AG-I]